MLAALAILALLYFFVVKEKKRTAVERSLGMSKRQCRVSLLAGLMILTIIAAGVGAQLGFQGFINIGVVTYLLPNTGLPLPFLSYGLTSLVSSFIGIGFVLNVGLQCKQK